MNRLWTQRAARRLLLARGSETALLLVVLLVCFWAYRQVYQARVTLAEDQLRLAAQPQYLQQLATLRAEMRGRAQDTERILNLVIEPTEVVAFIAAIEEMAKGHNIALEVPTIAEVQELNEAGEEIASTGPFRTIKLSIRGTGEPRDLLNYVHELEYGPYLVTVREWSVVTDPQPASYLTETLAQTVGKTEVLPTVSVRAELLAELILSVHNENYSAQ